MIENNDIFDSENLAETGEPGVSFSMAIETETKNLVELKSTNIHDHFPFPSEREKQTIALDRIANWMFNSSKKFFILEGPTGFGKSGVGMAAASLAKVMPSYGEYEPGAYLLSPQISLTGQYMNDFATNGLVELKGQSNYFCAQFDMDCESASMVFDDMHNKNTCTGYKPAKRRFMSNPLGVVNFSYYMAETQTAHQLVDRTLLVLDEGHNCESLILGECETHITQKDCDKYDVPEKLPLFEEGDVRKVRTWLEDVFVSAIQAKCREYERKKREAKDRGHNEEAAKFSKLIVRVEKYLQTIAMFTQADDPTEWFAWSDWDANRKKGTGDLVIKPLSAKLFADDVLFSKAQKVLIMSATILDFAVFMKNLGIDPKEAELLAVDSEFPLEHRPIYYKPVGNMRQQEIKFTLPKVAEEVEVLMKKYAKHKGIVHTQSFSNNKYLMDYLSMQGFDERIVTHISGVKGSREELIERHKAASNPTVIFSPSMTEGLDLKEDLGRWGCIIKVPYPMLDPYIRARNGRDGGEWYLWQTALKIVQATGRICRSQKDWGVMWILDAGFGDFLRRAKYKMPKWWRDSVIDLSKIS